MKNRIISVLVAVVLVLSLTACNDENTDGNAGGNNNENTENNNNESTGQNAEPTESQDVFAASNSYKIGDKVEITADVFMTVNHVWITEDYEEIFMSPNEEFCNINVTIQNNRDRDFSIVFFSETKIIDSQGNEYQPTMKTNEQADRLENATPAGTTQTGDITFDISAELSGLSFKYNDVFSIEPFIWKLDR